MAKQLKSFQFGQRQPTKNGEKYPWDTWLNGKIWELKKGEDFDIKIESMRSSVCSKALHLNLKAQTAIVDENTLVVQAKKRQPKKSAEEILADFELTLNNEENNQ